METTYDFGRRDLARRSVRVVAVSATVAVALTVAALLLLQQPAHAQLPFGNFICGILESLVAAFSNSPFFSFIAATLNALLSAFGCGISG